MLKLAVLVSGGGTNLQAIIDSIADGRIMGARIATVISNNKKAYALERAAKAGIPAKCVSPKDYKSREAFNDALLEAIEESQADLVVLAGCLVVIPEKMVDAFKNRIINIHPAYLPAFPGAHGIRDAYEAKVPYTGVTVHYVDEGIDTGDIIAQKKLAIDPAWSLETLETHVHALEYELFPQVVKQICEEIEEGKS